MSAGYAHVITACAPLTTRLADASECARSVSPPKWTEIALLYVPGAMPATDAAAITDPLSSVTRRATSAPLSWKTRVAPATGPLSDVRVAAITVAPLNGAGSAVTFRVVAVRESGGVVCVPAFVLAPPPIFHRGSLA